MESIEKNLNNDDRDQTTLITNNKRKQGEITFQGQNKNNFLYKKINSFFYYVNEIEMKDT